MSIKYKLLILCFLSLNICVGQNSNVDFETYFSDIEIQDLNNIADFFQCELCGTKKEGIWEMYSRFNSEILDHKYIDRNINYHKQKKLYRGISKSTFDKIWTLCKTWRTNEPKYEYKSLCFSGNKMFKRIRARIR